MNPLFFDLDGTLSDPKVGITRSIQYALDKLGHECPAEEKLLWCIGPPLIDSFEKILGAHHLALQAVELYRQRFGDTGLFENCVYGGIEQALADLGQAGHRLFVATSKPTIFANRILGHFKLDHFFEHVFGSDLDGTRSDKTELLRYALEQTAIDGRQATMIGDRSHDMIGARNNEMTAVGVLYGYGTKQELQAAGAHNLSASPGELPECL